MIDRRKMFQQLHLPPRVRIVIVGAMLQELALLLSLHLASTFLTSLDNSVYTIVLTVLFASMGSIIFLRMYDRNAALVSYVFFTCAALIICLLNSSAYAWSRILTVVLSIIVEGLAVTFVCVLSSLPLRGPSRSHHSLLLSPYIPLLLSVLLAACNLPALLLFPHTWTFISLIVYGFSLFCMLTMIWGILFGFQHLQAQDQSIASITVIGIILVLVSFMINSNNTLYQVPLLPTSVGFLLFYSSLVACGALILSVAVWGIHSWFTQSLHLGTQLLIIAGLGGIVLLVVGCIVITADIELLRQGFASLIHRHPFMIPVMILPALCYAALLHSQLSGKTGFLSRRIVRGMLWFSLASCLVWGDLLIKELGDRYVSDGYDQLFLHIGWFMTSLWLFPWLWEKARAVGDRMLYRDFYSYNRTLRNLSLALTRMRSFEQMCDFLLPQLATLLNAQEVALVTRSRSMAQQRSEHVGRQQAEQWDCFSFSPFQTAVDGGIQARFIALAQSAQRHLGSHKEASCVIEDMLFLPLHEGLQQQGFLCLGPKLNGERYNRQDLSFLETLTAQLATLEVNTRYAEQLKANSQQLTALNHRILQAQEDERRRLALELHDDVLQQTMLLTRQLTDANGSPQVAAIIPLARSVVQSLRTTCLALRPPLLHELGLLPALQWLGQQAEKQGHLRVMVQSIDECNQRLPEYIELHLYRVVQEALSNTLKHSLARLVRIRLRQDGSGAISLIVADNGCGLQSHGLTGESLGLVGMVERMESIGGTLHIHSSAGRGLAIRATYQSTQAKIDAIMQEEGQNE